MVGSSDRSDVILIAGKGHETYQEIAGKRSHFSDEEQARAAIIEREKSRRSG
jgi:UDP-N-acetylmuramoyl-L-alanyl-D-glutamate--2,6-diaminopimelate ligase